MLKLLSRKHNKKKEDKGDQTAGQPTVQSSDESLLREYVRDHRYGLIADAAGPYAARREGQAVLREVTAIIDERFALVPEGRASLAKTVNDYPGCPDVEIDTLPFLLARHTVTNAQFQKFVGAGGYEELEHWPKEIWPHLIDFKDLTDHPGPRFWEHGRCDKLLADHPVVGLCYYEAAAYARWAGFRLPSEAEWQMAASWRLRDSAHVLRRYPWGDAFDTNKCNLWASGVGQTVPVDAYEKGAAANGVRQLVGNVWEWTLSDFNVIDSQGRPVVGDMVVKAIRGGAFDTYFPSQATSYFRTGLACLTRAHNVGFRCVLGREKTGPDDAWNEGES